MENEHSIPPSPPSADTIGYRFALLLTGDSAAACEILRSVLASASKEMVHYRSRERRKTWLIRKIRAHALNWKAESPAEPNFLPSQIAILPEPSRSVFALFQCLDDSVEEMAELLRLNGPAFAQALHQARQTLAPETKFPKNLKLTLHSPWGTDPKRIAKAFHSAPETPELTAQIAADRQWHQEIGQLPIPAELASLHLSELPKPALRALVCHPAVLAIVLALLVVIGTLVYVAMNRANDFTGKETIEELVGQAGSGNGSEFEAISPTNAGELDDWFVMNGFEGFTVPPQLQNAKAVGCRIMRYEGAAIAQVALDQRNAMLFVFRVADLKVEAEGDQWRIFQEDDWAVAVRTDQRNGYLLMFQGDADEMPAFMEQIGQ